jgi:hypothetical protein
MKRLTYEFVKEQFENEGWALLTTEYKNNDQKLDCICSRGHKHSISWHNWNNGWRCPYCYGNVKFTMEFIRSEFEKEGYELLSQKYTNNWAKLKYRCPEGHEHSVTWNNWDNRGARCPTCFYINNSGSGNCNWKGGISCEPYCDIWLDKEFKEFILERDNHQCQNPNCWGTMPEDLTIHHIDYIKKHCDPWNLITLCRSCNARANKNREWHKDFYRIIVKKKYNFKEV